MTADKTIHLIRSGGKDGAAVTVWCGRFTGKHGFALQHCTPTGTVFFAVSPDNPNYGPTCGACRRSVGMLKQPREPEKRQRYRPRKQDG